MTMLLIVLFGLVGCQSADSISMEGTEVTADTFDAQNDVSGTTDVVQKAAGVDDTQNAGADKAQTGDASTEIIVDVDGAVNQPGVYTLSSGSRVQDAIDAAGGITDTACTKGMNRAYILTDGVKLFVPTLTEYEQGLYQDGFSSGAAGAQMMAFVPDNAADDRININTADANGLCQIKGVGETRADAIVAYREQHGPFASIEDIQNVSGIGPSTFEKIKDQIRVQ